MTVARYVKATLSTLPSARFAVGNCVAAGVHYFPLLSPLEGVFVSVDSSFCAPNNQRFPTSRSPVGSAAEPASIIVRREVAR